MGRSVRGGTRAERSETPSSSAARRPEVSEVRTRTFLFWLPVVAARLGPGFLQPDRATVAAFLAGFPVGPYARGTRATGANCLGSFWRWWLARQGKELPAALHMRLEKWMPKEGASDMLTREGGARMAAHALNFRDRAWKRTLFHSGWRSVEIGRLRVGDAGPHDEGYIELRVAREEGSVLAMASDLSSS